MLQQWTLLQLQEAPNPNLSFHSVIPCSLTAFRFGACIKNVFRAICLGSALHLEEFAFTLHLLCKCNIIIYSATASGPVTLHVLSSHNMSAESISDTLCLVLRFMSGLLRVPMFHRISALLVSVNRHMLLLHLDRLSCCCLSLCFSISLFRHSIKRGYLSHTQTSLSAKTQIKGI